MNTNIDIDEKLVARAMQLTGLNTKRKVVEEGLRALVRLHAQRELRDLRGRLTWEDERDVRRKGRRG